MEIEIIQVFNELKEESRLGEVKITDDFDTRIISAIKTEFKSICTPIVNLFSYYLQQQNYFKQLGERSPEKRFVSGESHYYLGRQFLLKVEEGKPNSVRYKGRCFEVMCTPKSKAKSLMKMWYRSHAKDKFAEYAEPIIARFAKYGVTPSSLYIQEMESRWGSCTPKGKIILNTQLIKAPRPCIEYVITHELCHLLYPNHTKAFWELLHKEMPDWERWKNKLERFML